jgi:hypothetical protein
MRNALATGATAALLAMLAPSAIPSAARDQPATQPATLPTGPRIAAASPGTGDIAQQARQDTFAEMQRLVHDICGTCRKSVGSPPPGNAAPAGSASPECAAEEARLTEGPTLCAPPADYIIAVVPDPVHTRLALSFDRLVEAVQQGLQDGGYQFVRAVIPWDHRAHAEPPLFESRLAAEAYEAEKAKLPGLMAFRTVADPRSGAATRYLLVLIVGEAPTGGIVKSQFQSAVQWIAAASGSNRPDLRILGPTFSGSLASLAELLWCDGSPCYGRSHIFSGSVSRRDAVSWFRVREPRLAATFVSFQEASDIALERFVRFLGQRHYEPQSIAILSEDETEYGLADKRCGQCVYLYFPREISRLRAAYQGLDVKDLDAGTHSAPHEVLPLNLEISGSDEDTVPAFSKQTALSQEGVLLGIVSELRKHAVRFIVLRATDNLDLLFLSRYLAAAYPQGRIVTVGPDVLFPREVESKQLHGILALTTYALSPVGNHDFVNYRLRGERIFPTAVEAGSYNALRSLLTVRPDEPPPDPRGDRYRLTDQLLDLYQYGWKEARSAGRPPDIAKTPPVHLLALGRDGYWPLADLGPAGKPGEELPTLLPLTDAEQIQPKEQDWFVAVIPLSWKVASLAAFALASWFACLLWFASVSPSTQPFAVLAPAAADARGPLIAAGALFLECIVVLLLAPLVAAGDLPIEHRPTWIAFSLVTVLVVLAAATSDLSHRAKLAQESATGVNASGKDPRRGPKWWEHRAVPLVILLIAAPPLALWWIVQGSGAAGVQGSGAAGVRGFAALRSLQLTSGLSPILPLLLLLGAGLWWAYHVAAGSVLLLDGRRFRLPKGVTNRQALSLADCDTAEERCTRRAAGDQQDKRDQPTGDYIVRDLLHALPPRTSPTGHYLHYVVLAALAIGACLLLGGRTPLMTLEAPGLEWLLLAALLVAGLAIIGTTARVWEIWLKTRRLLMILDSRPLREGFRRLDGFSRRSLWQVSLVTATEFQSLLARVSEARDRAIRMVPPMRAGDLAENIKRDRDTVFKRWQTVLEPQREHGLRHLIRNWLTRRENELCLTHGFGCLQHDTALAAGRALDLLAERWGRDQERPGTCPIAGSPDYAGLKACERFVCLVYVSFLLVVLMRIRSLMLAVAGMYIVAMVGVNSYPFQPRATIAALSAALLVYVTVMVTVVFAQMNRDSTLSHLTNTTPGELDKEFWIRTGSFVALPLFSYLVAQFPQINRLFYGLIEPAVQALHK